MTMNPMDRHARKQVLLTRIAFERVELGRELARVNQAARLPNLLRGAVGGDLGRSLFGAAGAAGQGGWVGLALSLLRRYRVAAALFGGVAPLLGGRRGWRRWVRLGGLAAAAWLGWRALQGRDKPPS
jgi:hypothetical protein